MLKRKKNSIMTNYKNDLQKRILDKIKKGNIKQKSRIFFALKNISF
jgi:hypothetical protein